MNSLNRICRGHMSPKHLFLCSQRSINILHRKPLLLCESVARIRQPLWLGQVSLCRNDALYQLSTASYHNSSILHSKQSNDVNYQDNSSKKQIGKIESSGKLCIVYTCKVCKTRSSKFFSKQSYEKGVVIVTCPGCDSKHLIADNLGWFEQTEHKNVEQMLTAQGQSVMKQVSDDKTLEIVLNDIQKLSKH